MPHLAILSSAPITAQTPAKRIAKLAKLTPFTRANLASLPSVAQSASGDTFGATLASGTVLRGSTIANQSGMVGYGSAASVGSSVRNTLYAKVWVPQPSDWVDSPSYAVSNLKIQNRVRGQGAFIACFETDAPVIGVAAGLALAGSNVRMLVDLKDGAGWKEAVDGRPYASIAANGNFSVFFSFGSRAVRRIYIEVTSYFAGIILGPTDTLSPYDISREFLRCAHVGDSIGYTMERVSWQIGGRSLTQWCVGGTGYVAQLQAKVGGGTATSNADFDFAAATPSAAGVLGFNDGTLPQSWKIDATMGHICDSRPDVFIVANGINDASNVPTNQGWATQPSALALFQYVRSRSDALLVVVAPWTGAARGTDGLTAPASRPLIKASFDVVAGPKLWIDNLDSTWQLTRRDGTVVNGQTGSGCWVTGMGTVQAPSGSGNADQYIGDGTHPGGWASTTTTGSTTLPAATINVAAASGGISNFPPSGTLSIQAAGPVAYPGQVVTYTGKTATTFTGCTGGTGTFPAGSQVLMYQTVPGEDYYGNKVAAALCDALAVL